MAHGWHLRRSARRQLRNQKFAMPITLTYPSASLKLKAQHWFATITSLLSATILLNGCAIVEPACSTTESRWDNELLYFGTTTQTGIVSNKDWANFLSTVVTPRFPKGLSVWQAAGQWQSANGSLIKETSFVLNLAHPNTALAEKDIKEIIAEYKTRFHQEAILRSRSVVCISF